jgi:hypothetical protein
MKTLDRSALYKTAAIATAFVATAAWVWLLYILVKWMLRSLHSI